MQESSYYSFLNNRNFDFFVRKKNKKSFWSNM